MDPAIPGFTNMPPDDDLCGSLTLDFPMALSPNDNVTTSTMPPAVTTPRPTSTGRKRPLNSPTIPTIRSSRVCPKCPTPSPGHTMREGPSQDIVQTYSALPPLFRVDLPCEKSLTIHRLSMYGIAVDLTNYGPFYLNHALPKNHRWFIGTTGAQAPENLAELMGSFTRTTQPPP